MTATATPPRPTPKHASAPEKSLTGRARNAANDAGDRILEEVQANPVAVLAGGIALGLFAGTLLPGTKREAALLGPLGARLNTGAKAAAYAARDAGKSELAAAGLSRINANEQIGKLVDALVNALTSAGQAAREAAAEPPAMKPARKPRTTKG